MTKVRTFFVQWSQYYDTHDSDGNPKNPDPSYFKTAEEARDYEKWLDWRKKWLAEKIVQTQKSGRRKAGQRKGLYIALCHNADLKNANEKPEKREKKPNHIHSWIHVDSAMEIEKAREFFEVSRKQNCMPVRSTKNVFEYMLHITPQAIQDHKHIYSEDELFGNFASKQEMLAFFHQKIASTTVKDAKIDDEKLTNLVGWYVRNGKLTLNSARHIFDQAYEEDSTIYFNRAKQALQTSFDSYIADKANNFKQNGRNLTTLLVTGRGGTGKTVLANALAYNSNLLHNWHDVAPTGRRKTVDIADGWSGQDTAVLNEFDGDAESFRAFCAIFDPHNYTQISSRNKNKQMLITRAFITTTQSPIEFVTRASLQGNDEVFADNIIGSSQFKNINDLLALSEFNDLRELFGDDPNEQRKFFNITKDFTYQVARRLGGIIEVKKANYYPYIPADAELGLSIDTDNFLKQFEIVDAKNFNFNNADDTFFNNDNAFIGTKRHQAILTSKDATTASTSYTLYKWSDQERKFLRGVTFFVADVTNKELMNSLGLAIDMIYHIAETRNAKNYEKEILQKAMND